MISIYTVLVGADEGVVRAALMGWRANRASQLGSRQDGLNSLGLVAAINPPEWVAGLRPQYVLLSVGAGNERSVLDREYEAFLSGYTLLRTDRNCRIHLSTDGENLQVEVGKR